MAKVQTKILVESRKLLKKKSLETALSIYRNLFVCTTLGYCNQDNFIITHWSRISKILEI